MHQQIMHNKSKDQIMTHYKYFYIDGFIVGLMGLASD